MNTKAIIVSLKNKKKLEKKGFIVKEPTLPPHLEKIIKKRADEMAQFDMYEVTVNLDMYDDNHPIHAII
ncbi:MAG: hypothetical protein GOVbin631_10 [Prokaryotic dsDNA virus sp.]|nr:MAG: hypothetical protein GOVbin631_10 [Prokaryotic dsDNA virus sp.]|tara:strand:- start:95 stop:301 length:207 start_codon:yes stop_codon:yes gene_type:complete